MKRIAKIENVLEELRNENLKGFDAFDLIALYQSAIAKIRKICEHGEIKDDK